MYRILKQVLSIEAKNQRVKIGNMQKEVLNSLDLYTAPHPYCQDQDYRLPQGLLLMYARIVMAYERYA